MELKKCPFCGGNGRISFKWEGEGTVKTGVKIVDGEYGFTYDERLPAKRYRVTIICNKCKSRGKPVFTPLLRESPYATSYSGRYKAGESEMVRNADTAFEEYVNAAADNWNRRC